MAQDRGNEKGRSGKTGGVGRDEAPDTSGRLTALPDLVRKAFTLGLSGFFLTEEAIRKALGDTIPKDWTDFAVDQSERARREFLERLSFEIAQSLDKVDVAAVLQELLQGRTLEIRAEIRLGDKEPGPGRHSVQATLRRGEEER
ncbi:MAG: hypothetical protein E4H11_05050 [Myxococcales bacterium]|nr:MAG: hypothetical protein E4H11_05050 [Myxococcales bacterium]